MRSDTSNQHWGPACSWLWLMQIPCLKLGIARICLCKIWSDPSEKNPECCGCWGYIHNIWALWLTKARQHTESQSMVQWWKALSIRKSMSKVFWWTRRNAPGQFGSHQCCWCSWQKLSLWKALHRIRCFFPFRKISKGPCTVRTWKRSTSLLGVFGLCWSLLVYVCQVRNIFSVPALTRTSSHAAWTGRKISVKGVWRCCQKVSSLTKLKSWPRLIFELATLASQHIFPAFAYSSCPK